MNATTLRNFGCIFLLLAAFVVTPRAFGQNSNTGEIKGTVSDATGAVVPDVSVSIKNVQTSVVTPTTTNQAGLYDVPFLTPGQYTITFSKKSFRDFVREGIDLHVETVGVNATLQLGVSTQEVLVNSAAPLVETETTGQTLDLNTQTIEAAPIVGTDWRAEMIQLIPGANSGGGTGMAGNGQQSGVNGTQGYNINFLMDGSGATDPRDFNSSNNFSPIDSIAEVSVNSGNAPAEYGNGLTAINVITKSGTNNWHGSAFEFIQNTSLNARGFYNATGPKSVEHWNDYGGSVGGPIIKDKLFFFFTYQRNPSSTPTSGLYSYPTAAMQAGDFFGLPGSTGPAFDSNGILLATPDAVAAKLQTYFPGSSAPGWISGCPGPVNVSAGVAQTCPANNNYVFNGSAPNTSTWYSGKIDYNISQKQKLSFSSNYYPNFVSYIPPDPLFPDDATAYSPANNYNLTGQLSDVYTISSTVVNEFRVGGMRELDKYKPPSLGKNDPTTIGLEPTYGTNAPANVFPRIQIDGGATEGSTVLGGGTGNGNIDAVLGEGVYNFSDVLTLVRGKHTIKVGGEYDRDYQNYTNWGDISSGSFEFNGSNTGIPYADFLSGDVYGWFVYESNPTSAHMWNSALFASDDIKVTPHLTLNLGLRYQIQSGWGVSFNAFGNYDPYLPNPADGGLYKGAILYGGQGDTIFGGPTTDMKTIQNADYKEFAPRVGIAWSPRDKWSIRASYGIFDAPRDAENYTDGSLGLGFNPHNEGFGGYTSGSVPFQLQDGPPAGTVVFPTLQTLSSTLNNFSGVTYYPRSMPTVYVQQFLLSVQHEFAGGILLDTSYVYTRGSNLNFATDIDQAPVTELGCSGYNCGNPNPVFNSIQGQIYDGWSNYNALQLRLQKRTSYGLNFLANYAWSKSLDTGTGNGHGSGVDVYQNAYNPAANYGLSDFNATNTIAGQVTYELPFGHGRQYDLHGVADEIAGGWRVSSVFQWHGGVPFTPVVQGSVGSGLITGLDSSLGAGSTLYPDLVSNPRVANPSLTGWFNPTAYTAPCTVMETTTNNSGNISVTQFCAPGTEHFGDAGRNGLIGPGFANADFSVSKMFRIPFREGMSLEIRGDFYDVFNHINFGNPDGDVGFTCTGGAVTPTPGNSVTGPCTSFQLADSASATITGPAAFNGNRRIIQLGAHFRF
jgi:outer membrane receptor protein involved in Fe transport